MMILGKSLTQRRKGAESAEKRFGRRDSRGGAESAEYNLGEFI